MARMIVLAILTISLWPTVAEAGPKNGCRLPKSDAEALEILSNYYPGYWWDHTDLTIASADAPPREAGAVRGH